MGLFVLRGLSTIYEGGCKPRFSLLFWGDREVCFELFEVNERQVLEGEEEGFWAVFVDVSGDL